MIKRGHLVVVVNSATMFLGITFLGVMFLDVLAFGVGASAQSIPQKTASTKVTAAETAKERSLDQLLFDDVQQKQNKQRTSQPGSNRPAGPQGSDQNVSNADHRTHQTQEDIEFVLNQMRQIEKQLGAGIVDANTIKAQQQVLEMLKNLERSRGPRSGDSQRKNDDPILGDESNGSSTGEGQVEPNDSATGDFDRDGNVNIENSAASRRSILDRAWGQLPEGARSEMPSVGSENFLPGYEDLIQQYYRRVHDFNQHETSRNRRAQPSRRSSE